MRPMELGLYTIVVSFVDVVFSYCYPEQIWCVGGIMYGANRHPYFVLV